MEAHLNQLKRVIDRLIIPQYPEIDHYKFEVKKQNDYVYVAVVYYPKELRNWHDTDTEKDKWKKIANLTKSYYDATGHDEHYVLGAIGEYKNMNAGLSGPFWYWKLDEKVDWREKRDENIKFYERRRFESMREKKLERRRNQNT
jgi:hypothetical protein